MLCVVLRERERESKRECGGYDEILLCKAGGKL